MITFHILHDTTDCYWPAWEETYLSSFPIEERRPLDSIARLMAEEHRFCAYALLHDGHFAGLLTCWTFDSFIYIEHFAIAPTLRSGGYGTMALRSFMNAQKLPIVLEAEPATDDLSARRIAFYERNGFVAYDYDYYQPPYAPDRQGIALRLMGTMPQKTACPDLMARTLHREVYGVNLS